MKYQHIVTGTFLKRPNRFLAHVLIDGAETVCHVKNTGRLKEFLLPGAELLLEYHPDAQTQGRKTSYSVIGVYKESAGIHSERLLINMDSQAPNQAAFEWLANGAPNASFSGASITDLRREVRFGDSRFDLSFRLNGTQALMEVKGVTLEHNGCASFPDAPTERGVKHILELCEAAKAGYETFLLFVIQMKGITSFSPNRATHPEFADALKKAQADGVHLLAYDCLVTEDSMQLDRPVKIVLS